jgi:hypothetical protein
LGCRHVFHHECLMPWLMEKRENECPSCRALFILDSKLNETVEPGLPQEDVHVDHIMEEGSIQVIPMGDGSETVATTIESSITDDVEASVGHAHVLQDTMEDIEEEEEDDGFSYVIAKGLIQIIPTHHITNPTLSCNSTHCRIVPLPK